MVQPQVEPYRKQCEGSSRSEANCEKDTTRQSELFRLCYTATDALARLSFVGGRFPAVALFDDAAGPASYA